MIGLAILTVFILYSHQINVVLNPSDNLSLYVQSTDDFDFTPELIQVAKGLNSTSQEQTLKNIMKYVYDNVQYNEIDTGYCYAEKASTVFQAKKGDCVSMTKLSVTLARIDGIPARSKGGCVTSLNPCAPIFSVTPINQIPMSMVQDNKKRGFLHEWSEAYINGKWVLMENTADRILDDSCANYITYSYDSTVYDRCVISDNTFTTECFAKW